MKMEFTIKTYGLLKKYGKLQGSVENPSFSDRMFISDLLTEIIRFTE